MVSTTVTSTEQLHTLLSANLLDYFAGVSAAFDSPVITFHFYRSVAHYSGFHG